MIKESFELIPFLFLPIFSLFLTPFYSTTLILSQLLHHRYPRAPSCVSVISYFPTLHLSESGRLAALSDRHQVYADKAFLPIPAGSSRITQRQSSSQKWENASCEKWLSVILYVTRGRQALETS